MGIFEIADGGLGRRESGAADAGALMDGGKEGVGVVARSAFAGGGHDGDKAREVFVFGAESVSDPASHRRADEIGGAGVEKESRRTVGHSLGVHGVDEAKVIDVLGNVRKEAADPTPGLAVLFEIPEGLKELALALFSEGVFADADEVEGLSVAFDEFGFVVEGIDMAGAARHEEEDDALGAAGKDGKLRRERIVLRGLPKEGGERKGTEAASGGLEKLAAMVAHGFLIEKAEVEAGEEGLAYLSPGFFLLIGIKPVKKGLGGGMFAPGRRTGENELIGPGDGGFFAQEALGGEIGLFADEGAIHQEEGLSREVGDGAFSDDEVGIGRIEDFKEIQHGVAEPRNIDTAAGGVESVVEVVLSSLADGGSAAGGVKLPADEKGSVANELGFEALARRTTEETILGIAVVSGL